MVRNIRSTRAVDDKADGYYHARISIITSPVAGLLSMIVSYVIGADPINSFLLGLVGSALFGLILSPDLDQDGLNTRAKTIWSYIPFVGWVAMYAWAFTWHIYGDRFKHRGISHKIGIGTLTRMIYLFIAAGLYYLIYSFRAVGFYAIMEYLGFFALYWRECLFVVIGVAWSDAMHAARDYLGLQL